ncbi:MAG: phosphomannose isomerase type II C-terminal cupin domain [archaeon]
MLHQLVVGFQMKKAKNTFLTVKKPWGHFTQYTKEQKATVKIIQVNKGGILSLQSHKNRDELWVALDGGITAQKGKAKKMLKKGESIFIPKNTKHRLSSKQGGQVLEISFGKFDESDIKRFEDKYGRAGKKAAEYK